MNPQNEIKSKTNDPVAVSVIAYFTIVGWLIAAYILNSPRHPLSTFHIRQALGLNLLFIFSGAVFIIPIIGWIVGFVGYGVAILQTILGISYAISKEEKEVPILGREFQTWFAGL